MPHAYRLLVVDIDGTLVDKAGHISSEDSEALLAARRLGLEVTLSTGRAVMACREIIGKLALDGYHVFFDGALVSSPDKGSELYAQPIKRPILREMVEFARLNGIYLELFTANSFFVERETWATEIRRRFFTLEPIVVDFNEIWNRERIIKAQLITASPEEAAGAQKFREHFDVRLHFSWAKTPAFPNVDFINVVDPGVSKGKALQVLAAYLGIAMAEVMAIGDGLNDISLLSIAGLSIAMQDAPARVREMADYVTLDVDHSGVAVALKKFIL
jgi:Cof subfamily protein (haloacid dehalogenase superfamily)